MVKLLVMQAELVD